LILLNYNLSLENVFAELCTVTHFNTSKSSRLISRPGKVGSYKQPLIQQIAHGAILWGWGSTFLTIVTSSSILNYLRDMDFYNEIIYFMHVNVFMRKQAFHCGLRTKRFSALISGNCFSVETYTLLRAW
jgi:hypothetical protein